MINTSSPFVRHETQHSPASCDGSISSTASAMASPEVTRLRGAEAVEVLMQNVYPPGLADRLGYLPHVFIACTAVARDVPVFRFSRPWDFATLGQGIEILERSLIRVMLILAGFLPHETLCAQRVLVCRDTTVQDFAQSNCPSFAATHAEVQAYDSARIPTPPVLCEISTRRQKYQRTRPRRRGLAELVELAAATLRPTAVTSEPQIGLLGCCSSNDEAGTRAV